MPTAISIERRHPRNETVPVSDRARAEADDLVDKAQGSPLDGFYLVIDGEEVRVGDNLSQLLAHVVEGAANRGSMTIRTMPEEISTTVAAHELGISRPTLMKMIRAGELPSHTVGTHTRLKYSAVREFAQRRDARQTDAFRRLLDASEALGER